MTRNKRGQFTRRKRRTHKRKRARVYTSTKPKARRQKKRRRHHITGLPMKKGGSIMNIATDGLKATGGAIAGRIVGKLVGGKLNLGPIVQGGLVFVGGVLVAKTFDRSLGLGMAAAGGELAAAQVLPPSIMGIGDIDAADVDAIERAAMRGIEDVVNGGDDVVNGDDDDVVTGDDDE